MKQLKKIQAKHSQVGKWQCISHCGACCNLTPEDRPELAEYLSSEELEQYLSMVGEDGWCINYDHNQRQCQIYEQRPRFCRVESDNFQKMYDIELEEFNEFAIACCQQQIAGVYGKKSAELAKYNTATFNHDNLGSSVQIS
ncbi:MAG: YkgJ family cysteine cluster protein [Pleurocapsa sp.]